LALGSGASELAIAPVRDRTAGINGEFLKIRCQSESFGCLLLAYTKANSAFAKQACNNSKSVGSHHRFCISGPLQPGINLDQGGFQRPNHVTPGPRAAYRYEPRTSRLWPERSDGAAMLRSMALRRDFARHRTFAFESSIGKAFCLRPLSLRRKKSGTPSRAETRRDSK